MRILLAFISAAVVATVLAVAVVLLSADEAIAPHTTPSPAVFATVTPTPSPSPAASLTLDAIFPPRDLSALRLDPLRIRTLIATGDVIPARYTDVTIRNQGDDFFYPFAATTDILHSGDLTVINLEAPLIDGCPYHDSGFTFCGRPGFAQALEKAGVKVVTLENNHIGNYGVAGIEETRRHLTTQDLSSPLALADRDEPAVVDSRGLRFGFLAFNAVGEAVDRPAMVAKIKALRPKVDILLVSFHWGAEYVSIPQIAPGIADDDPIELGHLAVDAGADLIIGNHPHWVQAVELYKGKFIAYAHGNFIFDQMWSYETRVGVIGKYTFYDSCGPAVKSDGSPSCPTLVGVEYIPTLIENYAQPRPLEGAERQAVLDGMKASSAELAARAGATRTPVAP